jgi:hypothetical protein
MKKYNLTLATGHSPAQEDLMLIRQARKLSSGPTASSRDDRTEPDCP